MIKEEADSRKQESIVEEIERKQQNRINFDIIKNEYLGDDHRQPTQADLKQHQTTEEFKKFLLSCIWEKRIPKNEIIMMNLVQNIMTLSQAVKDETIPLPQALKILVGLQKVF